MSTEKAVEPKSAALIPPTPTPDSMSDVSLAGLSAAKFAASKFKNPEKSNAALEAKAAAINEKLNSVSKFTGFLFSKDDALLLPTSLRPGFETFVDRIDAIQIQIDAFRPQIEMLIYYENVTNTITWTFSILFTWLLARWNFSFAWCILILWVLGGAFKRNLTRLRRKIRHDVHVTNSTKKMDTDEENVEWFNSFLSKFWLLYEPSLSESISDSVNSVLDASKPTFLEELRLTTFTLGSEAPRIESIKTYPRTEDDILMMDWTVSFSPFDEDGVSKRAMETSNRKNSKIVLTAKIGKGIASIPLPILLKEVGLQGVMRIQLKFSTVFPHIKVLEFGFLTKPKIDFVLRPLKSMDLMDTPGLSSFLTETIDWQLEQNIVNPNKIVIPLEEWMGPVTSDVPVGVLTVSINVAKGLKNTEVIGVSDPYAAVFIGGMGVGKTKIVDNTLSPQWNETRHIIIYQSQLAQTVDKSDNLYFEVFDFNNLQKDKSMGRTAILPLSRWVKLMPRPAKSSAFEDDLAADDDPLSDAERDALLKEWGMPSQSRGAIWKPLFNPLTEKLGNGELNVEMLYHCIPTVKPGEEDTGADSGILRVTVHQVKELAGATKSSNLFAICETNNSVEVARTHIKKKSQAPIWEKSFDTFITDLEGARITFKIRDEKDMNSVPMGHATVTIKDVLAKKDTNDDWYKLFGVASGKIRLSFSFTPLSLSSGGAASVKEPVAMLNITLIEAKNMLNVESFKKSDPYCDLKLGTTRIGKTKTIENTLDPKWDATFRGVCHNLMTPLMMEFWDFNPISKAKTLGTSSVRIEDAVSAKVIKEFVDSVVGEGEGGPAVKDDGAVDAGAGAVEAARRDGFKVESLPPTSADVWSPIYVGSGKKEVKQKGHVHFHIEVCPVVWGSVVRVDKKKKNSLKSEDLVGLPDAEVEGKDTEDAHVLERAGLSSALSTENLKANIGVFDVHPSGIVHLYFHDAKGLYKEADTYAAVYVDDVHMFSTNVVTNSKDPSWNQVAEFYAEDIPDKMFEIRIESTKDNAADSVIAVWKGEGTEFVGMMGKSNVYLSLSSPKSTDITSMLSVEQFGKVRVSLAYFPVYSSAEAKASDIGVLHVDIISASNLEAVDSGGASDPYCVVSLNHQKVHKTKTLKKSLNPQFNESFQTDIKSRSRSTLVIEIFDHNKVSKDVMLGSVNIPLHALVHGEVTIKDFRLENARSGSLKLQVCFLQQGTPATTAGDESAPVGISVKKDRRLKALSTSIKRTINFAEVAAAANTSVASSSGSVRSSTAASLLSKDGIVPNMENARKASADHSRRSSDILSSIFRSNNSLNSILSTDELAEFLGEGTITIAEARNLKAVDKNGLSDPFVKVTQIYHGKSRTLHKTDAIKNNLNPVWKKETFKFTAPPSKIRFAVKDKESKMVFSTDTTKDMGELEIDLLDIVGNVEVQGASRPFTISKSFDTWYRLELGGDGGEIRLIGECTFTYK